MKKLVSALVLASVACGSLAAPSFAGYYTPGGDYVDDAGFLIPNDDDDYRQRCRRERVMVYDEFGNAYLRRMNDCPDRRIIKYRRPNNDRIYDQKEIGNHSSPDSGQDRGDKY